MPSSTRKSSVGPSNPRRGPQKAHIPYRADDLEHGKKTGIAVTYVDHASDGFEPFDEIMMQADGKTPVAAGRKKNQKQAAASAQQQERDEDGEMSMELDDSAASPSSYFAHIRNPPVPSHSTNLSTTRRLGQSSSQPIPRTSDVDFDSVPSPRRSQSSRALRQSNGAGPSNLSKSIVASDDAEPMDDGGDGGYDDYDPQGDDVSLGTHTTSQRTPRRTSFSAMDQDDDDEEEETITPRQPPSSVARKGSHNNSNNSRNLNGSGAGKGKGKARTASSPSPAVPASDDLPHYEDQGQDPNMDMEDDIAQGLNDVEQGSGEDENQPPAKKAKATRKPRNVKKVVQFPEEESPPSGVRRSRRHRYPPLEWWRQERVVYGRRQSGLSFVPHIKEIIRIPQDPPQPLGRHAQGKRKRSVTRAKSESRGAEDVKGKAVAPPRVYNPEEGWDDDTNPIGVVLDYLTRDEVSRRLAWTAKMVTPKAAANSEWFFDKVFGDGEFIAAGQLIIPPKGRKPSKGTKDNTYIFYVIEGAVNLKVHNTALVLATGAMFMVPRGNTYFIENIADRDAKLFFTQARKVVTDDDVITAPRRSSESMPRRVSVGSSAVPQRSSSEGAPGIMKGTAGGEKVRRAMSTKV